MTPRLSGKGSTLRYSPPNSGSFGKTLRPGQPKWRKKGSSDEGSWMLSSERWLRTWPMLWMRSMLRWWRLRWEKGCDAVARGTKACCTWLIIRGQGAGLGVLLLAATLEKGLELLVGVNRVRNGDVTLISWHIVVVSVA